jgi:hypothetical protein
MNQIIYLIGLIVVIMLSRGRANASQRRTVCSILNQRAAFPGSPLFLVEFRPRLDGVSRER